MGYCSTIQVNLYNVIKTYLPKSLNNYVISLYIIALILHVFGFFFYFYLLLLTIIEIKETANTGILTEVEKWLVVQLFVSGFFFSYIYHLLMLLKKEKHFVVKEN